MPSSLQSLRLGFKRAFIDYYLALCSPAVADPTEAFASCYAYLAALRERLGQREFMARLDQETTQLMGEIEQDLRQRLRKSGVPALELDPVLGDGVEGRLRECIEEALHRLEQQS